MPLNYFTLDQVKIVLQALETGRLWVQRPFGADNLNDLLSAADCQFPDAGVSECRHVLNTCFADTHSVPCLTRVETRG